MASALQKLLRNSPATRIIASLHCSQGEQLLARRRFPLAIEVQRPLLFHPSPVTEHRCDVTFPSFPFGFWPKPVAEGEGDDEWRGLWADSVKKKRKRKMNKHKYKKLRKRMKRKKN